VALDPEQPTVRWAAFGRQVELFLEGDIGTFVLDRARVQIEDAMTELKRVDPFKPEEIIRLQNRVAVAESIVTWLGEAIAAGHSAIEELKNA
jgi:hypothetical protein